MGDIDHLVLDWAGYAILRKSMKTTKKVTSEAPWPQLEDVSHRNLCPLEPLNWANTLQI